MKRVVIAVAVVLGLCAAPSAQAATIMNEDGSIAQPFQLWSDLSDVPVVSGVMTLTHDTQPCLASDVDALACIDLAPRLIHFPQLPCGYGSGRSGLRVCRFIFMHELGHEFDYEMPAWKRARFSRIIRTYGEWTAQWPNGGSLRETFADYYAACALGSRRPAEIWDFGELTFRQFRRICHLIDIPN